MSLPILAVLALIVVVGVVLIADRLRPDLMAMLVLVSLGVSRLVSPDDLFSGFSRSAVVTIMSMFIISGALEVTGVTRVLGNRLNTLSGGRESRAILVVMVAAALLSLVMNNIAAAAVLLPAVIGLTRHGTLHPSKLLMPLSFGALLGGMATLFATANLLVSATLAAQGLQPYGVLDFLPVGGPMAVAGIAFMVLFGRRLLPDRPIGGSDTPLPRGANLNETYGLADTVREVYVLPGSPMAGRSVVGGGWGQRLGVNVIGLSRGGKVRLALPPAETVLEGDVVLFTGELDAEDARGHGLIFTQDPGWHGQFVTSQLGLVEVVLAPRSALAGKTLREINLREKFDLTVVALWREGQTIRDALADIPLRFGDALLMHGPVAKIQLLRREPGFLVLVEDTAGPESPRKAWLSAGLAAAAFLLPALGVLPIAQATFAVAALLVLCRCLSMDEAYEAIEWKTIFVVAGMLPLGLAMVSTGAASLLAQGLTGLLGGLGPLAAAGGLYLATMLLTQVISGQVAAAVIAPIAIVVARTLGADPRGMAMAAAMGCSTPFLTPFAHPANLLVMGTGGYTVRDYSRVGLPLTAVLFVVALVFLHLFWRI